MMVKFNPVNFIFFFCFVGCAVIKDHKAHVPQTGNLIVYRVFDSLEQILCRQIGQRDSVAVIIEPMSDYTYGSEEKNNNMYIFKVSLFLDHTYKKDSILSISNRRLEVCGKYYPVYFLRVDDVFCTNKNDPSKFHYGRISKHVDLYYNSFYKVDMMNKKILFSTY